jgi:DNA polymerase-1
MNNLLLIDGHSILNRAYYGIPILTNHEGIHTNAIYGFINIMLKAIEDEHSDSVAVAFDLKAPTFRHKMYDVYKGTRKPMPEELREQVPIIKEILSAMNIPVITLEGYEADDILGTLAKREQDKGVNVVIMSGDRDLLQLADKNIKIRLPKTIKGKTEIENYYPADVVEKYGTTPTEFIDLKGLMGDTSDNIPGVPGIGEKTATAIIMKYHSIENAYEHVEEITPTKARNNLMEHYDMAVLSKKLATIEINAPVEFDISSGDISGMFTKEAYDMFKRYELKSLLKYFEASAVENKELIENFRIVNDYFEVDNIITECVLAGKVGVATVVENGNLYGVSLAYKDRETVYISCEGLITEEFLKDKLTELADKTSVYTINLKAQVDYLSDEFKDNIHDLALMSYLINPLKSVYSYEDIASEYLNASLMGRQDIIGKNTVEKLMCDDISALAKVYGYESYTARYAFDGCYDNLEKSNMKDVYLNIELPLIYVLRSMEKEGMRVNKKELKQYGDNLTERINELESLIYEMAGEKFNINSPKQLGEILFDKMGLPSGKKTKTGYSTSADILEKLAVDYPVVSNILEYRTLAKLKSTYAEGLAQYIGDDERIHSTFNQMITATGRISSTEPNLQNIPIRMELGRLIRKVFIPKEGYVFVDADYSQIELRLLAHMSGDKTLIDAYNEDSDIHRITASKVFKVPFEEVTQTQRSNAKAVNFGIVYGISSFGLSRDLSITPKEAKNYIDEYFKTYPSLKSYLDELINSAKEKGYSETLYGRRRPVPELASGNFMQRQFGERIAMNSPLQGTAADIIKIAMINVYNRLKKEDLKSKLILQVHDELLVETAIDEKDIVIKILIEEMQGAANLMVPLMADVHSGNNWYEAK